MTPKQMTRRGEKHDDDNDNDHITNSQNAHHQNCFINILCQNMRDRFFMNMNNHSSAHTFLKTLFSKIFFELFWLYRIIKFGQCNE